ncbi:MAG: toxin-antitoxin (TA) system antitoxin [Oscillatoria sp. SIO1A7]|nr:toxin-antitoxin (TA) system antitoxin [Oscillatoria sp. SIO1A7]
MITKTVDVESQISLTELLSLLDKDTEIVLMEGSTMRARVVPCASSSKRRTLGLHRGAIWTSDDFDEPLPEKFCMGEA